MSKAKYPEHEKLAKISDKSQAIGDFIQWLRGERGFTICKLDDRLRYVSDLPRIGSVLADYFEINESKIEKEKLAMLAELRAAGKRAKS